MRNEINNYSDFCPRQSSSSSVPVYISLSMTRVLYTSPALFVHDHGVALKALHEATLLHEDLAWQCNGSDVLKAHPGDFACKVLCLQSNGWLRQTALAN
jgi:hypothetical protein